MGAGHENRLLQTVKPFHSPENWRKDIRRIFAKTADGVWASDAQGKILFWNEAAEAIIECSARQVVGRQCCDIFRGLDINGNQLCSAICPIKERINRGETVHHFDMLTVTKTRTRKWLDVSCLLLPSSKNEGQIAVHSFRDITAARRANSFLRQLLTKMDGDNPAEIPPEMASKLTRQQLQVVKLLRTGATTVDIASRLSISRATVRNHIQNIFTRLNVHSRIEAVASMNEQGTP